MTENDCVFCDLAQFRAADVCIENAFCLYASTRDPRDPPDVLPGCGVIIPIVHRASPFDFTAEEWAATHELLLEAKAAQDERLAPDGYTLIWNCFPESRAPPRHSPLRRRTARRPGRAVGHQGAGEPAARPVSVREETCAGVRAATDLIEPLNHGADSCE